jgi:hypothetical protein
MSHFTNYLSAASSKIINFLFYHLKEDQDDLNVNSKKAKLNNNDEGNYS